MNDGKKGDDDPSCSDLHHSQMGKSQAAEACIVPSVGANGSLGIGLTEDSIVRSADSEKGNFMCTTCGKAFGKKRYLRLHGITHSGEKRHGCSFCGKHFLRKSELVRHFRSHTGEKMHTCGLCGKKFTRAWQLKNHINIHNGVKDYKCDHCEKTFTQKQNLAKHVKIHSEKDYSCRECGKSFRMKDSLANHMKSHSAQPVEKHYTTCRRCGKTFSHANGLTYHQKNYVCIRRYMGIEIIKDKFPHEMDFHELQEYSEKCHESVTEGNDPLKLEKLPSENYAVGRYEKIDEDLFKRKLDSECVNTDGERVNATIETDAKFSANDDMKEEMEFIEEEECSDKGGNSDDNYDFNIEFVGVEDS